jgi:hypothetical protein
LNNCHIPMLALQYLKEQAKNSFFYYPELEVLSDTAPKKVELDICCCVDGNVIIGEAKRADELANTTTKEEQILRKYLSISDAINAKTIVLCTFTDGWKSGTIGNINKELAGKNLKILTKADLLKEN